MLTEQYYNEFKNLENEELQRMEEKTLKELYNQYDKLRVAIYKDDVNLYNTVNIELRDIRCKLGAIQILLNQRGLD